MPTIADLLQYQGAVEVWALRPGTSIRSALELVNNGSTVQVIGNSRASIAMASADLLFRGESRQIVLGDIESALDRMQSALGYSERDF